MGTGFVPSIKALIFIIGILFSMVVGLLGTLILLVVQPLALAALGGGTAFGTSMGLWIAAMALWSRR